MRLSVRRQRLNRRAELGNGTVKIACVHEPPSGVRGECRRLFARLLLQKLHAFAALGSRSLTITELPQNGCEIRVRSRKIWLQSNGFPQSIRRRLQVSLLFQHRTQGVISLRIIRLCPDRRAQFFSRSRKISLLPQRHTERVVSIRQLRVQLGCFSEFRDGL